MRTRYDYSSTQVNLPESLANDVICWGLDQIPDQELYRDPSGLIYGREFEPHITILYGIYDSSVRRIKFVLEDEPPFEVRLGRIGVFENDRFDVVKIEADSLALYHLNSLLQDHFPCRNLFPIYCPHITVAYVRKGHGKRFEGIDYFEGQTFSVRQVLFSGRNGEKAFLTLRGRGTKT